MAKPAIELRGLTPIVRLLQSAPTQTKSELKALAETTGRGVETEARQNAAAYVGQLKMTINYEATQGGLGAQISVFNDFLFWLEFGTGALVDVQDEWGEFAEQFRGKGIRQVNLPARPFFFPAWYKWSDRYYVEVKRILDRIFR